MKKGDIDSLEFLVTTPFAIDREIILSDSEQVLSSLKDVTRLYDLQNFTVTDSSYRSGAIWNDFDQDFIEKHLKGTSWRGSEYYYASDKLGLHFIVYRPENRFGDKLAYFRIEELDDH